MNEREFDVVLYGATGFVGALAAEYLAAHGGTLRWAIAGRSADKLRAVAERAAPGRDLPCIVADAADTVALAAMTARTRVVLTTVGPYLRYGQPLLAACVENGTHYLDLTGEHAFVAASVRELDARARETGAAVVHCVGFDSVPTDLGARLLVDQLPRGAPKSIRVHVRTNAMISGGSALSLLEILKAPIDLPDPGVPEAGPRLPGFHRVKGGWALPMPMVDTYLVRRAAAAEPAVYGPALSIAQYMLRSSLVVSGAIACGVVLLLVAARIPPLRRLVGSMIPAGSGPTKERRARSRFEVTLYGEAGGVEKIVRVSGGDPGYDETAKMASEAAMWIARHGVPRGGVLSPSTALGLGYVERLREAGLRFDVIDAA